MAGIFYAGRVLAVGGTPLAAPAFKDSPVEQLFVGDATWTQLTPLEGSTSRCGVGEDSIGHLIVFGGVDASDPDGDKGKAYWYDLIEGKKGNVSQRTASAPDDHFAYATDADQRVYSIGGGPGVSATVAKPNSSHVERYDAVTNLWTAVAPMPVAVADAGAVYDGAGRILVVGGYDTTGGLTDDVTSFDVATGSWSATQVPDLPVATADHAIARGADGRIYVIGGRTTSGLTADVWVLDAGFTAWSPGTSLPTPRADASAALADDDQLYLLGGRDGLGGTDEVLTLFTPTCPTFPGSIVETQKVWRGMTAGLTHVVEGGAPLSYRWRKDGVDLFDGLSAGGGSLTGADTQSLQITQVQPVDAGVYELLVSNGCGQRLAPPRTLEVLVPPAVNGVWSFESLAPSGAIGSAAYGLGDGLVVGDSKYTHTQYGTLSRPHLWPVAPGAGLDLTPPASVGGALSAARGGTQVGWYWWPYTTPQGTGYNQHACVWSGTAGSYIDVQPSGWEFGSIADTDGTHHVGSMRYDEGSTSGHAAYWPKSQKSAINLTPAGDWGSSASAIFGGEQFGSVVHPFASVHAAKWSGTAASFENLNPTGSTWSYILDASEGAQVGRVTFAGVHHAGLWGGSAQSFLDLNPTLATGSSASATDGGLQIGSATLPSGSSYAILWSGAPDDFIDLKGYADANHPNPVASDIEVLPSGEILVSGYAYNASLGQNDAILWHMNPKSLVADNTSLSLAAGGTQTLTLEAGLSHAGLLYLILGSASGTSPGLFVNAVSLPLNLDGYLLWSLSSAGTGLFQGTLGFLDASGGGTASLSVPAGASPSLIGLTLHHAGLVFDVSSGLQAVFATNAEPLSLLP